MAVFSQLLRPAGVLSIFVLIAFVDCKPEEEVFDFDYNLGLHFSKDTVLFDTIFTGAGSTTKRLKISNPHDKAISVKNIRIGGGSASPYKILVNGTQPQGSDGLDILGQDSVLILVEVFIDPQNEDSPFLVNDSILFETNGISQNVKLVAWGQDANYIGNVALACNSRWTKDRPYVVFSSILVDSLCQLTIEPGTRIFAARDAFIFVDGSIRASGTAEERIILRNERLDARYDNIPGQWGGLFFSRYSKNNELQFTTIRNAQYGIRMGSPDNDTIPDMVLKNVIIENMSNSGILAFTSDLYAENTLINNCIEFNCANIGGGNYVYNHCTFANYSFNFIRQNPQFVMTDNIVQEDGTNDVFDLSVILQNSIIHGSMDDELFFDFSGGANVSLGLANNIFTSTISELDTFGNRLNIDPLFVDPARYNYRLDTLSPAKDTGINIGVLSDLDGNDRDELPDLGAYERIE